MTAERFLEWARSVSQVLPGFVRSLEVRQEPGRYRMTPTGDVRTSRRWGLGQTTFAVRILFQAGHLSADERRNSLAFIRGFERANGIISDPFIAWGSFPRRLLSGVRHLELDTLTNRMTARAETRQAVAALYNLGAEPRYVFNGIPYDEQGISAYIEALDWTRPWGAASHVNHLLFFLKYAHHIDADKRASLVDSVISRVNAMRQPDGSYHASGLALPACHKVGSAMKILMGATLVGRCAELATPELIDTVLDNPASGDACEHFNTLYSLYRCLAHIDHRASEAAEFALRRAAEWNSYYWPEYGGFSFNRGHSTKDYYAAPVCRGLKEPDMHGSAMFFWGILVIARMLGLDGALKLNEPLL